MLISDFWVLRRGGFEQASPAAVLLPSPGGEGPGVRAAAWERQIGFYRHPERSEGSWRLFAVMLSVDGAPLKSLSMTVLR